MASRLARCVLTFPGQCRRSCRWNCERGGTQLIFLGLSRNWWLQTPLWVEMDGDGLLEDRSAQLVFFYWLVPARLGHWSFRPWSSSQLLELRRGNYDIGWYRSKNVNPVLYHFFFMIWVINYILRNSLPTAIWLVLMFASLSQTTANAVAMVMNAKMKKTHIL